MKKIVLVLLVAVSLFASNKKDYVGIGTGYSDFTDNNLSAHGVNASFALGHRNGKYGRILVNGTYIGGTTSNDSSMNVFSASLAYDFMFPIIDDTLDLFAGPLVGYTSYKDDLFSVNGVNYGLEAGATYAFSSTFELEAGGRYINETASDANKMELGNRAMFFLQMNFFFDAGERFKYED